MRRRPTEKGLEKGSLIAAIFEGTELIPGAAPIGAVCFKYA